MGSGESGAQERTRTFTAVKPLAPEASASTNSTTWARGRLLRTGRAFVTLARRAPDILYSADLMAYRGTAKYTRRFSNLTQEIDSWHRIWTPWSRFSEDRALWGETWCARSASATSV